MSSASESLILPAVRGLVSDFGLTPVMASEIEFYLTGAASCAELPAFWDTVRNACDIAGIGIYKIEQETGHEQYEIALQPHTDLVKVAFDTHHLRVLVMQVASVFGMSADFSAKPIPDQPGSGLHFHVHLANAEGKNVFFKDDDKISAPLFHCIGGLLEWLPDCMAVFAPLPESYARFAAKSNGPTTVSWGANNRTVAIRLPDAAQDKKRIEHRVSGADADPSPVIAVILAAMHDGMKRSCIPGEQVFGDASLEMYGLPRLPQSQEEAAQLFTQSTKLPDYFNVADLLPDR